MTKTPRKTADIDPLVQIALDTGLIGAHEVGPVDDVIMDAQLGVRGRLSRHSDIAQDASAQRERADFAENEALTDDMTKLFNKKGFKLAISAEIKRIEQGDSKGAIVVAADMDYLKWLNDHPKLGTHFGDAALIELGNNLKDNSRETDAVSHLQGDEFGVLLTDVESGDILKAVNRVTKDLSTLSTTVTDNGIEVTVPVRATFGYVTLQTDMNPNEVIDNSLSAMHRVKDERPKTRGMAPPGFENF